MDQAVVLDYSPVVARAVPIELVMADPHTLPAVGDTPLLTVHCKLVAVVGSFEVDSPRAVDSFLGDELDYIDE